MKNVVDHPCPCMPSPLEVATTMTVDLAPFGMPGRFERLVVVPSPLGDYVVACLPFFSYGIHFGDLVRIRRPGNVFDGVLNSAGLRTFRFAFNDIPRADTGHDGLHGRVVASGLPHEWHGAGFLAVLLRDKRDQDRALEMVSGLLGEGGGSWEVDPEPFA